MSYLQKIVYLTEEQYSQLAAGTLAGHPGTVQNDILYITTDQQDINDLPGTLSVSKGGTGRNTFVAGQLLVGNGTNGINTMGVSNENISNTVVKRDGSGNFSANTITAALNGNANSSTTTTSLICSTRPSTANTTHNASQYGRIFAFLSSSNMNNSGVKPLFTGTTAAPTALDGYILDFHWDNSGQYNPQIAINNGGKSLSIRGNVSGTWSDWVPILTRDNIGTGDNNGQIKVAGTNVSVKGLQALAYKASLASADIPNNAANTTGTAANVTGTVAVANGGTGATDAATARTNLGITLANLGAASSGHTHGNITNSGCTTTDITLATGDFLLIADASESGKIGRLKTGSAAITFDTTKADYCLTRAGTWAQFGNTYTLPLAANGTRGGVQIGYNNGVANGKNYPVLLDGEKMYVNVPWTDTNTYVTQNTTTADKKYGVLLSAYETSATTTTATTVQRDSKVYVHPSLNQLVAGQITIHDKAATPVEKVSLQWNATDLSLDFVFT